MSKTSNTFIRWAEEVRIIHGMEVFVLADLLTGSVYQFLSDFGRAMKKQQIEQKERNEL